MLLSYVVIIFPPRRVIMSYMHLEEGSKREKFWFYMIGTIIVLISVVISILVPSISTVLSVISAILGIGIRYLIPYYCLYMKKYIKG